MAVKIWMEMDHTVRLEKFRSRSQAIADGLIGTPGVITATVDPNTDQHDPHGVNIEIDPDVISTLDLVKKLKEDEDSPFWTRPSGPNTLRVAIFGLLDGEDELVTQLIKAQVTVAAEVEAPAVAAVGAAGRSARL